MAIIKMATINWILESWTKFWNIASYNLSLLQHCNSIPFFSGKKISFKWYKYKEANFTHVIWPQNDMTMALCKTRSRVIDKGNSQGIDFQGYVWVERRGRGCLCNFLVLATQEQVYHLPITFICYINIWMMSTYLSMCINKFIYMIDTYFI